ncbi:hypothetical protein RND71_019636 [Anisodus tanguticus]|uniref:Uncharacterized protein n=1 Tax=Anisodus tanguticus TaxID=243964 RepID=A0AAE1VGN6_9SOLA|nr:hypothetical protein RND71_019636 [Anisodus tanguticus]
MSCSTASMADHLIASGSPFCREETRKRWRFQIQLKHKRDWIIRRKLLLGCWEYDGLNMNDLYFSDPGHSGTSRDLLAVLLRDRDYYLQE